MSVASGPKVVTDGLVFAYDMGNTQKSWRGRPSTNLAIYSNTLANWSKVPYQQSVTVIDVVNNAAVAPDGSMTASYIIPRLGVSFNQSLYLYAVAGSDVLHTVSVYVKYGGFRYAKFGSSATNCSFDLLSGTWVTSVSSQRAEYCGNGWWRLSASFSIGGGFLHYIWTSDTPATGGYPSEIVNANGTSGMYVWGCQIELGAGATTLLPTNGSTTSRSNTQAIIDLTSNNTIVANSLTYDSDNTFSFSNPNIYVQKNSVFYSNTWTWSAWLKSTTNNANHQGIVWGEGALGGGSGYQYLLTLYGHSYFHIRIQNATTGWTETNTPTITFSPTNWNNIVWQFNNGVTNLYINGQSWFTNSSRGAYSGGADSPLYIGSRNDLAYPWQGQISNLNFYNKFLSADEIQQNFNALRGRYGV